MTALPPLALLGGDPVVPLGTPRPRWPVIDDNDEAAVLQALRHHDLSAFEVEDGPLFDFEAELRKRFGRRHALLVANGTAALQSAIFALGIGPGDEVIVPASTFPGTGGPILHRGATVRLCDVDPETGNPTPETVLAALRSETRAIVIAQAGGIPASPDILSLASERGIAVVEDGARALGSRLTDGRQVGTMGTVSCFSFHALKAVPAGEGGVVLTDDRELYERSVALGHYFRSKVSLHLSSSPLSRYRHSALGLNLKIHPLAAALARSQLGKLDRRLTAAKAMYDRLLELTSGLDVLAPLQLPEWIGRLSFYGYMFHWRPRAGFPSRDAVVTALRAEGIPTQAVGGPPLHHLELYRDAGLADLPGRTVWDANGLPGAESFHGTALRLQTLYEESPEWVERYAQALEKVLSQTADLARWERDQSSLPG